VPPRTTAPRSPRLRRRRFRALDARRASGGSLALIDFLVEHGAGLEGVVNSRGWTPLRIADGVGLDGLAFIRYPEAAAHLRALMEARGLPVPPVEWDGPREAASQ
jgi:hypothetical protein